MFFPAPRSLMLFQRPHQRPLKSPAVMHFRTSSSAAFNAPFAPERVLNFAWKARACFPPRHERLLHTAPSSFRHFSRAVCVANVAAKFEQNLVTIFVLCWSKRSSSQSGSSFSKQWTTRFVCFVSGELVLKGSSARFMCKVRRKFCYVFVIVLWFVVEGSTLLAFFSVEW